MASSSSGPLVVAPSANVEMASSSSDEVIVVRDGPAKQGTKRSYSKLVECDGPLKLALLVASQRGGGGQSSMTTPRLARLLTSMCLLQQAMVLQIGHLAPTA